MEQDSERKLATIAKILNIEPIQWEDENGGRQTADNIVWATVRGWKVITQKSNNFSIGDLCVFFEIDSLMPLDNPEFEFLRKKESDTHHRLKTIRLKNHISQGLILPLSVLTTEQICEATRFLSSFREMSRQEFEAMLLEGEDLTHILGITKYEPPIHASLRGKVKGYFPGFLRKTDEERIQNITNFLNKYKGVEFYSTEKLDGTSFTAYYRQPEHTEEGSFGVCSRNLEQTETPDSTYWQLARKIGLEEKMASLGFDVCIQGEMVGPGIQDNKYKLTETALFVFNMYPLQDQVPGKFKYFSLSEMLNICEKLDLTLVPILDKKPLDFESVDAILKDAEGPSILNPNQTREGKVWRPTEELWDDRHGRVSFKAISNAWLLKHE